MTYYEKERERLENVMKYTKDSKPFLYNNCLKRIAELSAEEEKMKRWVGENVRV